jgi:hypothetical protein
VAQLLPTVRINYTNGNAFNVTLRISSPQAEAGAFATSYIPTTSAAVTRSADSAVVTPISSFYNQAEGTLFAEYRVGTTTGNGAHLVVDSGDIASRVSLFRDRAQVAISGVYTDVGSFSPIANTAYKAALAYAANNHAATVGGAAVSTNTLIGTPSGLIALRIGVEAFGGFAANGHIRKIAYWPKRLTNTLLEQLTT